MLEPVAKSPVESPVRKLSRETVYCTEYDGASYYTTTDATMIEAGNHTWCCEAWINSTPSDLMGLMGDTNPVTAGTQILWTPGNGKLNFAGNNLSASSLFDISGLLDRWIKVVAVHDWGGSNFAVLYVNGSAGTNGPLTRSSNASTSFRLGTGPDTPTRELYGKLRNVEVYSGVATNPTEWIPGDTSSLSGVTLKYQSIRGNSENEQGISWTKTGAPALLNC